jgi:hypothetical protein
MKNSNECRVTSDESKLGTSWCPSETESRAAFCLSLVTGHSSLLFCPLAGFTADRELGSQRSLLPSPCPEGLNFQAGKVYHHRTPRSSCSARALRVRLPVLAPTSWLPFGVCTFPEGCYPAQCRPAAQKVCSADLICRSAVLPVRRPQTCRAGLRYLTRAEPVFGFGGAPVPSLSADGLGVRWRWVGPLLGQWRDFGG